MSCKVVTALAIFFLIIGAETCQAKKILCLMGIGAGTTDKWNKALLQELENRQHQLTIVTATSWTTDEDVFPNARLVHLEKTQVALKERYESITIGDLLKQSTWKNIIQWYDRQMATCRANLESIGFSEALHLALKEKGKYDLIIYDIAYGAGCLLHLAYLFGNTPIIGITSGPLNSQSLFTAHESLLNPALDPHILSDFNEDMNYWKRWHNTALYAFDYLYQKWVLKPVIEGLWAKNMHAKNIFTPNDFKELMPRFQVVLANHHPSLHSLQSLPANVVAVPGLHIQETSKTSLSSEILKFIESGIAEAILVELQEDIVGLENIIKFFEALKSFPQTRIIWANQGQANSKKLQKNQPQNLMVTASDQTPQILAHPKVKCSVISSNLVDIQESLYHGVVPLTITTKPEQRYIAQRLLERNLGLNIELTSFEEVDVIRQNLKNCLKETSLSKNVHQFERSMKEQQNPSMATATWWVEHILQNPKANDHLWTSRKDSSNFLVIRSLDIIVVIQIFLVLCVINSVMVMRQTIANFKEMGKKSKKKIQGGKIESLKKLKKSKSKTS
ncbi:UDP-glucuronosyltransferase 2B15 [Stomoxys calcitrans]|uniref:UDP-glucuronosyltransferase 2B15 n=1 Tax=Stomoxys calcitrans TaxID=35570 RepID=UPI0027E2BEE6|nr:UDP-glucuronosyltransferase 2B15 [Stomoxys calcitrans]